jgi:hypothetical protein
MFTFNFNVGSESSGAPRVLTPKQLGILSSIPVPNDLKNALEAGYGATGKKREASSYLPDKIHDAGVDLKNTDHCDIIACVGGSIVHSAIRGDAPLPFVALVGAMPATIGQYCLGGISLESWASNRERILAVTTRTPITLANIALYRNPNSGMALDEATDWNKTIASLSAGAAAPIVIDSTSVFGTPRYNLNFNTASIIPANVQGIVISADPLFLSQMDQLVAATKTWLAAGAARYVVFPLQIYAESIGAITAGVSPAGQITLYGPDLYQAYYKLGQLAQVAQANPTYKLGFDRAANLTVHL